LRFHATRFEQFGVGQTVGSVYLNCCATSATHAGLTPAHICAGTGLTPAPHLRRDRAHPRPHLRRDWAQPCHICAGTGLTV
jgi:hypothetical protein